MKPIEKYADNPKNQKKVFKEINNQFCYFCSP